MSPGLGHLSPTTLLLLLLLPLALAAAPSSKVLILPFRHEHVHFVLGRAHSIVVAAIIDALPHNPASRKRLLQHQSGVVCPRQRRYFGVGAGVGVGARVDVRGERRKQYSAGHRDKRRASL